MNERSTSLIERLRALFALSVEPHDTKGECPPIEDLAALIDGNLSPDKRESLLAHLDACPECYHEWLAAASILKEHQNTPDIEPYRDRGHGLFRSFGFRVSMACAMAASLAILVYVGMFRQPSLSSMINRQYRIAMEAHKPDNMVETQAVKPLQKSNTVNLGLGFTGSSQTGPSPYAQTFVSGFQSGRTMLGSKEKTFTEMESIHKAYFWAGRWFALLSYLCDSDILGHELAHLANNDFWHLETFMALSGETTLWSRRLKNILETGSGGLEDREKKAIALSKEREMAADDLGFIYAAISGFSMKTLCLSTHGEDFFSYWMEQTHTRVDRNHAHPKERVRLLQIRLKRLGENVDFFEFGSRLSHFGRYDDALYFLKEFQNIFPSREVFNNIGYCYLQMAIKRMPTSKAYDYWFPWVLDLSSRTEATLSRSGDGPYSLSEPVKEWLDLSIVYFEKACNADISYIPSRLNLVTAYYYSGHIYKARAMVEEVLLLEPRNADIQALKALVMIEEAPNVDMWPYAIKTLKILSGKKDASASIQYNLGRLLEKRKRNGEALNVYKTLAVKPENLPPPFRLAVLEKAGLSNTQPNITMPETCPFPLNMPVRIGQNLQADPEIKKQTASWEKTSFTWQNGMINGAMYTLPIGNQILAVNDFVEMLIIKNPSANVNDLTKRFGNPFAEKIWGKTVLSYSTSWAIVAEAEKIKEIWIPE